MVSGIPTASGYEERIRFSEIEVVERGANQQGLVANAPSGHEINGWDVNVAGVRTTTVKRHVRYHETSVCAVPSTFIGVLKKVVVLMQLPGVLDQSQAIRQGRVLHRPHLR
jgi:hypothetical protein